MDSTEQATANQKISWAKVIKTLLIIAALVLLSGIAFFGWLNFYTDHGDAFSVPDFKGHTVAEAESLAQEKELRLVVIDSVYSADGERGTVIDQNPPPDFKVKQNRRIFVTIKSVNPKIIKMPDFRDMTFVQAKADVESYGLKIGKIIYKPSKYDNVVLEQEYKGEVISPGTEIEQYSEIDLVLGESQDMGNSVTPMLIGLTRDEAQKQINERNLNTGVILYDETVVTTADSVSALVRKQFPVPNVPLNPGDDVDLWMSMLKDTIF